MNLLHKLLQALTVELKNLLHILKHPVWLVDLIGTCFVNFVGGVHENVDERFEYFVPEYLKKDTLLFLPFVFSQHLYLLRQTETTVLIEQLLCN